MQDNFFVNARPEWFNGWTMLSTEQITIQWLVIYLLDGIIHLLNKPGLAPVVQKVDNTIHWINRYPVDSAVCFVNTYPVDSVIQPFNNWGLMFKR